MGFTKDFTTDIVWTTTPYSNGALQELPCIEMIGYQQTWSAVIENVNAWMKRFKNAKEGGNPYEGLYVGTPGNSYKLPYFSEHHHAISQGWGTGQGGPVGEVIQNITNFAETIAKTILPAAGILSPQSYEGGTPFTYSFTFNLINTTDKGVSKNKEFLEMFIKDNLHGMNGCLSITPPLIYEVYIPGVRFSPAAVVSGLTVNNKGTMNKNTIGSNYIYPDAWEVTVSITELIVESKTIYNDAIQGKSDSKQFTTRVFP